MLGGGTIKNSKNNIGAKRSPFVYFSTSDNNFPKKKDFPKKKEDFKKDFNKDFKKTFNFPKKKEDFPKKEEDLNKKKEDLKKEEDFKKNFKKDLKNFKQNLINDLKRDFNFPEKEDFYKSFTKKNPKKEEDLNKNPKKEEDFPKKEDLNKKEEDFNKNLKKDFKKKEDFKKDFPKKDFKKKDLKKEDLKKEEDFKKNLKKDFKKKDLKKEDLNKKDSALGFSSTLGDEKPSADQLRENSYIPYSYLSSSVWRLRTGRLGSLLASPNIDFKTRYGLKTKSYPDAYFVTKEYICRKIINCICKNGKKRLAYGIFNRFILELRNRNVFSPREYVTKAVLSLRPLATLRKNIVSGVVKKIPSSINMRSSVSVALNWFVRSARDRTERTMVERLVAECLDILSNRKCLSKNKKLEHYKIIHANRYLIYNKKDFHYKNKVVVATQQPVLEKKVTTGDVED